MITYVLGVGTMYLFFLHSIQLCCLLFKSTSLKIHCCFLYAGALLQKVDRDTQKCAYKCCFAVINEKPVSQPVNLATNVVLAFQMLLHMYVRQQRPCLLNRKTSFIALLVVCGLW